MSRYYFLVGLLTLTGFVSAEQHTIRGTHWGMTLQEVIETEKWEYHGQKEEHLFGQDELYLFYYGKLIDGLRTRLYYKFVDGLLVSLWYEIEGDFYKDREGKSIFLTFQKLEKILVEKYGKAKDNRTNPANKADIRTALSKKKQTLLIANIWHIHQGNTDLTLYFSVKDYRGVISISYTNMSYKNQSEQLEKDKKSDEIYSVKNGDDL